jgi:hypothetical protein
VRNLSSKIKRAFRAASRKEARDIRSGTLVLPSRSDHMNWERTIPFLVARSGISPYVVYSFMKTFFGRPHRTVRYYSDRKTQWEYVIKTKSSYLRVYDWKLFGWGIGIETGDPKESVTDARLLLSYMTEYAKDAKIPVGQKDHELIENVFFKNYSRGSELLDLLDKNPDIEKAPLAWTAAISFMLSVEALLNIVYDLYVDPSIHRNSDLYQHIERLSLTDKWLLAPLLCTCFSNAMRRNSKGYQRIKNMWKMRTDLVHSKITEDMRVFFLRKDGLPFATSKFPIGNVTIYDLYYGSAFDIEFVRRMKEDVGVVVSELIAAMKSQLRRSFSKKIQEEAISFERARRRLAGPRQDYWY